MQIKATARVQVTLEMDLSQPWGPECSIGQLYKQAAEQGAASVHNAIKGIAYRIIGEPKVIGVFTEKMP